MTKLNRILAFLGEEIMGAEVDMSDMASDHRYALGYMMALKKLEEYVYAMSAKDTSFSDSSRLLKLSSMFEILGSPRSAEELRRISENLSKE